MEEEIIFTPQSICENNSEIRKILTLLFTWCQYIDTVTASSYDNEVEAEPWLETATNMIKICKLKELNVKAITS